MQDPITQGGKNMKDGRKLHDNLEEGPELLHDFHLHVAGSEGAPVPSLPGQVLIAGPQERAPALRDAGHLQL